jgi:peptidyl-prolyl cis-trans isomerase C
MTNNPSRFLCGALAAVSLAACQKGTSEAKSGPILATVGNQTITADEMKKHLEETSPFLRARYATPERKKEFLENLIRNELLAQEAERQGLDKSPTVREQMKRAMIQELIKKQLDERMSGNDLTEADLKKFYEAHIDDFVKPERARVFRISLPATNAKERTAAKAKATAILKDIDAREKKGEANAFQMTAIRESKDATSAPLGGDLRFSTKEELVKSYGPEIANAAFAMSVPGEKSRVFETPTSVEVLKLQVKTAAMNRGFDESKESIRSRVARERRSHEYDEWIKKLRDDAKVTVDEAELAKVNVEVPTSGTAAAMNAIPHASVPMPRPATAPVMPAQTPPTAAAKIGGQ